MLEYKEKCFVETFTRENCKVGEVRTCITDTINRLISSISEEIDINAIDTNTSFIESMFKIDWYRLRYQESIYKLLRFVTQDADSLFYNHEKTFFHIIPFERFTILAKGTSELDPKTNMYWPKIILKILVRFDTTHIVKRYYYINECGNRSFYDCHLCYHYGDRLPYFRYVKDSETGNTSKDNLAYKDMMNRLINGEFTDLVYWDDLYNDWDW